MSKQVDEKEAWELMQRARHIVLVSHIGPDGDTLGSTLGLYHALQHTGKEVTCLVDDTLPAAYHFCRAFPPINIP